MLPLEVQKSPNHSKAKSKASTSPHERCFSSSRC